MFHVRGTAAFLNGRRLPTTRAPMRVEVQDSIRKLPGFQRVDPTKQEKLTLSW
jgi:hypothetical protein